MPVDHAGKFTRNINVADQVGIIDHQEGNTPCVQTEFLQGVLVKGISIWLRYIDLGDLKLAAILLE